MGDEPHSRRSVVIAKHYQAIGNCDGGGFGFGGGGFGGFGGGFGGGFDDFGAVEGI